MRRLSRFLKLVSILIFGLLLAAIVFWQWYLRGSDSDSNSYIREWLYAPILRPLLATEGGLACEGAPFILPASGYIGLLWSDVARPYNVFNKHSGIDIFGDGEPGSVANYAAYDGYLTRLSYWKSAVIIRHDDPLQPGRIIWTYYAHMASEDGSTSYIVDEFPAGTSNKWVEQGTLLGYQGTYSGVDTPIAMHLHFSIVTSDAQGMFLNETGLSNTLDPSPYLGMSLDFDSVKNRPIRCP